MSSQQLMRKAAPSSPVPAAAKAGLPCGCGKRSPLLRTREAVRPRVQASLRIGASDDPAEGEADRIADRIMAMPAPGVDLTSVPIYSRRPQSAASARGEPTCGACERDHDVEPPTIRAAPAPGPSQPLTGPAVETAVAGLGAGSPLPDTVRAFFEPRFGRDLSGIRIHTGNAADSAARALGARAFAIGDDIAFAAGRYDPGTAEGRRLLAHELVHTIQQESGLRRTVQRVREADCAAGPGCTMRDGTVAKSGKFSMTIYADKEGPFLLIPVTSGVGHAWLRLENDSGEYWTYGFWPSTGFDPAHPRADVEGCVHSPDVAHQPTSSQSFELTAAEFGAALSYAQSVCAGRPKYSLFGFNCTTFVSKTLAEAGKGSFGGFGLIWESPNALDAWMRVHALQIGFSVTAASSAEQGAGTGTAAFDLTYRHQFYSLLGHKLRLYGVGQAELSGPIKTIGAGTGISVDAQKVWLPSIYLEGLGTAGDLNPVPGKAGFGAGLTNTVGLRYNIDAFGSVGIEHNLVKDLVSGDPALSRLMIKLGINLW
jgi:hypothetical protein